MRILYTGGTGFIGAGLVPALLGEGHSIVLLSRRQGSKEFSGEPSVRTVSWNGRDEGQWTEEVNRADAVLNFAGEPLDRRRWTPEQKARIIESRVGSTRTIVTAIRAASRKPDLFINASGMGYYGDTGDALVTEQSPPGTGLLAETCKRWEEEARGAEKHGVRTVMLRLGVVLGKKGGALPRMVLPFKFYVGGPLGSGNQWFPWVHRADLVSIILSALSNRSFSGPINVAAPEAVTNRQFCTALGQVLARPCWIPVPQWSLRLVLGEMASMVLTGQHVVPARLQELGYSFQYPTVLAALQDILHPRV